MSEIDAHLAANNQSLLSERFVRHHENKHHRKKRTKESTRASKEMHSFLSNIDLSQIVKPDEVAPSDLTSKVGNCSYDAETATTVTTNSFEEEGSELPGKDWRLPDLGFLEEEQDEAVDDEQGSSVEQPQANDDRRQDTSSMVFPDTESWLILRLERIKRRFLSHFSALGRKESGAGLSSPSNKWTLRVFSPDDMNRIRFQLHEKDKPATMTVFDEEIFPAVTTIVETTSDTQFEVYSDTDNLGLHFWGPDLMVKLPEYVAQH